MPKLKFSNATFWVIFKHCVVVDVIPTKDELGAKLDESSFTLT